MVAICLLLVIYGFTGNFKKTMPVKAEDLKAWINYLTSDEMRGRANGSPRDEGKYFDYDNMAGMVEYFSNLVIWLSDNEHEIQFTDPSFARLK